jgi:glucose-6-phosphate dehydrogenase assembly protein OpcA
MAGAVKMGILREGALMARYKSAVVPETARCGDLVVMRVSRCNDAVIGRPQSDEAFARGERHVELITKIHAIVTTENGMAVVTAVRNWWGCCLYDRVTGIPVNGTSHCVERILRYVGRPEEKETHYAGT